MLRAFTCSSNGAVAFLGSSTSSEHGVNNDYNKLLYKNLLDSTVYCLGDLNMKTVMDLLKSNLNLTKIVKSGNKLVIKNGNQGVKIRNNFECEKGAVFEVK